MSDTLRMRLAVSETIELHKWRVAYARSEVRYHRAALDAAEHELALFLRLQADALESLKPDVRKKKTDAR